MISVEMVIQELLRAESNIAGCMAECEQYRGMALSAMDGLGPLGGEGQPAAASLSGAADSLNRARLALAVLRDSIRGAVSHISK